MLREPSKLRLTEVVSLWEHWRSRQKDRLIGLEFVKEKKGDMRENDKKGKKRADITWVNPDEELDENLDMSLPDVTSQSSRQRQPQPAAGPSGSHHQENEAPSPPAAAVHSAGQEDPNIDEELHVQSPAANKSTKKGRMAFLKRLSTNSEYLAMLKDMARLKVGILLAHIAVLVLIAHTGKQCWRANRLVP